MALLEIDGLAANYGAVRALHGVSMAIDEGSIVSLLGSNGAGKSTTLKAISGMVRPSEGTIKFDGQVLNTLSPNQIVKLGVAHVPEGRKVFKDLTVLENLKMGAYTRKSHSEIEEDLEAVHTLFPKLKERSGQLGGSLSGGEQQMLAIGRGLMTRPRLLLLDEPSLGLAPIIIKEIFDTLTQINKDRGTTLLVVEQNVRIALKNSAYGYVLEVGRVAVEGTSQELETKKELLDSYMGVKATA